jgi:hypothetical protein
MMATLKIGERSSGTLRSQDLAETYLEMADEAGIEYSEDIVVSGESDFDYLARWLKHFNDHEDEPCEGETFGDHFRDCPLEGESAVDDAIDGARDSLGEYAPPFSYIGSIEGDGACIGVWADVEAVQEAMQYGVKIDGEHTSIEEGDFTVFVSDHGNMTLFDREGKEVWGVV